MKKNEFLKMMKQDIATEKEKSTYEDIVALFDAVIPSEYDINAAGKTPQDFYNKMYEYARKEQKNGYYCFSPDAAKALAVEYLGIDISAPKESLHSNAKKIISLVDLLG